MSNCSDREARREWVNDPPSRPAASGSRPPRGPPPGTLAATPRRRYQSKASEAIRLAPGLV